MSPAVYHEIWVPLLTLPSSEFSKKYGINCLGITGVLYPIHYSKLMEQYPNEEFHGWSWCFPIIYWQIKEMSLDLITWFLDFACFYIALIYA